nr:hypothetical protein [Tanacetum cinerariifolium]
MSCSNTNDSSMYTITNKRAKINLESSLLWHCRLGHISKKRIEKLQQDELLNSIGIESLGKCVSCMSGKMARKPYSYQVERAKDLLGLIHTDVCGPFKIMSRQGASYFVTFTDDFNRYGYVYLLKHKHEVFETFKVFQKEVENQLGKTIKSLRSDHGERRNRTLLDMVRSIMSQTTLSKSFWDYALETAARILNMVPTKKVDKTPYEIWHGQAPKMSYLKVWGCEEFVKRDTLNKPDKLDPRSFKSKRLIGLCQRAYIKKILKIYYMENSKRETIPMQEKLKLSKSQGASTPAEKQRMENIPYASAVGSIMYVVRCTHPDVAFAQNMTSCFQQNPCEEHWTAVKNILKYLRNTKDMFLVYGGNMERELRVSCYTDAGYLTDADNIKS